uniref:Uncharacterized protein n=1 Tax=Siphoviridae sp. ctAFE3 TaxID=2827796 RepID=A0A8S5S7C9_9CAUD|nr:MAG TPA: hypothetical protein [Siphoviridae sp. ctAFE3]DAO65714.1 MAG TPA: hypothetical protein [Caudoviricetes sp.]DAT11124.1 MAG TPA: hypothetical protein [Caudoviricetes sp.]DAW51247.1 MAG TPA: hypothetical protein [Caudoviricetes sp.]DAY04836.1 MAG TPA: hypothetical protein [Caudoviricetes sp.]
MLNSLWQAFLKSISLVSLLTNLLTYNNNFSIYVKYSQ